MLRDRRAQVHRREDREQPILRLEGEARDATSSYSVRVTACAGLRHLDAFAELVHHSTHKHLHLHRVHPCASVVVSTL